MKKILTASVVALLSASLNAQTEKFDIAEFIAPRNWQRVDSNGVVLFHQYKTVNEQTSFCQIFLFPRSNADNNALRNFQAEWASRVTKTTGNKARPKTETKTSGDGWTAVTGYTNITQQGVTYTCMLASASGFGKVMSVLVNLAGQDYVKEVDAFFESMTFSAGTSSGIASNNVNSPVTGTGSLSDYNYKMPAGWRKTVYPDGIVLSSPGSNTGERCSITLWPMRAAGSNLQQDASGIFFDIFKAYRLTTSSTPASMVKGISPQGWEYFIIKNAITLQGNDYATLFGFLFIAKLGNRLAVISGMSKDPLVSSCFGLQLTDVWPTFFYSLHFKIWHATVQEQAFRRTMAGVWMSVTGSAGDRFAFAPNGRYAGASAAQRYYRVSSMEILRVTDAYFGDGAYTINGNHITLTADNNRNNSENGQIRVEQESRNEGKTWVDKLYLLRKSKVDGSIYEVCYDKQNN